VQKKYLLPILLLVQIMIVKTLAHYPEVVEKYYSMGFYPLLSKTFRFLFGSLSFSIGDVMYGFMLVLVVKWFLKNKKNFFKNWKKNSLSFLSVLSIFYFLFHALWGMNYYRMPLNEKLKIEKEYTSKDLEALTQEILIKTNRLQFKITSNSTTAVIIPYTEKEMFKMAPNGYHKLPNDLKDLDYYNKSIKESLFSLPLSYMGFGGYLNPFTNEAQINYLKPKYTSPLTICHEMAHQTGLGSESECNFIGFLAAKNNTDDYFQYAAYSFALNYCLYNLELIENGKSKSYFSQINKGVLKNFKENDVFWNNYKTPIHTFFEYFYDHFLKANQQKDGMEGYSKFIGLLIGYEKISS
tara:strand:+ start:487 stop:1545 length:1059 start_codon:yes stop_codon:yes gene_type:complete